MMYNDLYNQKLTKNLKRRKHSSKRKGKSGLKRHGHIILSNKKKEKDGRVGIHLMYCTNSSKLLLRNLIALHNDKLREVTSVENANLVWTDQSHSQPINQHYLTNHFPLLNQACQKHHLAHNLNLFQRLYPKDYNFIPHTWILPEDFEDFKASHTKSRTYILKPSIGQQGDGIYLAKRWEDICLILQDHATDGGGDMIIQSYISKPLLLQGFKFDLRVYVLLYTDQGDPSELKYLIFKDGLGRFCTTKYQTPTHRNIYQAYMHLTNYSLNKHSDNFKEQGYVFNEEEASKRRISTTLKQLKKQGSSLTKATFWEEMDRIAERTLTAMYAQIWANCSNRAPVEGQFGRCFQLLGFDVIMDQDEKLWLLEVNASPSFNMDSEVDIVVKSGVITSTLMWFKFLPPLQSSASPSVNSSNPSLEDENHGEMSTATTDELSAGSRQGEAQTLWGDLCTSIRNGQTDECARLLNLAANPLNAPQINSTQQPGDDSLRIAAALMTLRQQPNARPCLPPVLQDRNQTKRGSLAASGSRVPHRKSVHLHDQFSRLKLSPYFNASAQKMLRLEKMRREHLYNENGDRRIKKVYACLGYECGRVRSGNIFDNKFLKKLFNEYCPPPHRLGTNITTIGLTSSKFVRMCSKYKLLTGGFTRPDVDLLFLQLTRGRVLTYDLLCEAILRIARKRLGKMPLVQAFEATILHMEMNKGAGLKLK